MKRTFSFYIEEELLEEIREIAKQEYRTLSRQIIIAIREYVKAYKQNN